MKHSLIPNKEICMTYKMIIQLKASGKGLHKRIMENMTEIQAGDGEQEGRHIEKEVKDFGIQVLIRNRILERSKKKIHLMSFSLLENRSASNRDADLTRGEDLIIDLHIDFMDAIAGCNHSATVVKHVVCSQCNGTRAAPDSSPSLCAE